MTRVTIWSVGLAAAVLLAKGATAPVRENGHG